MCVNVHGAEDILRKVQEKNRLHACAMQVLGDLLESGNFFDVQKQINK